MFKNKILGVMDEYNKKFIESGKLFLGKKPEWDIVSNEYLLSLIQVNIHKSRSNKYFLNIENIYIFFSDETPLIQSRPQASYKDITKVLEDRMEYIVGKYASGVYGVRKYDFMEIKTTSLSSNTETNGYLVQDLTKEQLMEELNLTTEDIELITILPKFDKNKVRKVMSLEDCEETNNETVSSTISVPCMPLPVSSSTNAFDSPSTNFTPSVYPPGHISLPSKNVKKETEFEIPLFQCLNQHISKPSSKLVDLYIDLSEVSRGVDPKNGEKLTASKTASMVKKLKKEILAKIAEEKQKELKITKSASKIKSF